MDNQKNALYFAGGRKFKIDVTDNQSSIEVKKLAGTDAKKNKFEFTVKFTLSEDEVRNSLGRFDDLSLPDSGNVEDLENVLVLQNAFDGEKCLPLTPKVGMIKVSAVPFAMVDASSSESPLEIDINLGFSGGGKTNNAGGVKTNNAGWGG